MFKRFLFGLTMSLIAVAMCCAVASVGGKSVYDGTWTIEVIDSCAGVKTTYFDCRVTESNDVSLTFIPNQGRMGRGSGEAISVPASGMCISVIKKRTD
jgi:hypothetical protein